MQDTPVNVEENEASATETNVEETQKFPLLDNEKTAQWMVVSGEGLGSFERWNGLHPMRQCCLFECGPHRYRFCFGVGC